MAEDGGGWRGSRWRMALWGTAALVLLLPLVGTQLTEEMTWTGSDFLVLGAMVLTACGTYELAARASGNTAYRAAAGVAIAAGILLVWLNLSVGIIGTEQNPANLMYGGVLAVGIIGAALARLRPRGMSRALAATALAQALVAVVVLIAGLGYDALVLTVFFGGVWLLSAWLFRRAAAQEEVAA